MTVEYDCPESSRLIAAKAEALLVAVQYYNLNLRKAKFVPMNQNAPGDPFGNPRNWGGCLFLGTFWLLGKGAIIPGNRLMVPRN